MDKKLLTLLALVAGVLVWYVAAEHTTSVRNERAEQALAVVATSIESPARPDSRWLQSDGSHVAHVDGALQESSDHDVAGLSVAAYQKQRMNVYFDKEEFAQDWLAMDEDLIKHLSERLEEPPDLEELQSSFLDEQPAMALERMAHIDVLEQLASANVTEESSAAARDALTHVIEADLRRDLSATQKRMMVGEKYDALNALARISPEAGAHVFARLDSEGKKVALKGAMLSALLDRGAKRAKVLADFDGLLDSIE